MNYLTSNNLENNISNQANQNNMSLPLSKSQLPQVQPNVINNTRLEEKIIEVYQDNFIKEIKRIGKYLKQYPYIGMDTEFPGIVYPCISNAPDFYYQYIKLNVDKLKLIQLGITLTNGKGEQPPTPLPGSSI